jgi:hypothetical protein
VVVGAATADVAAHPFADRVIGKRPALGDEGDGRHDMARRAVAALKAVTVQKSRLHRMQFAADGEALDGRDRLTLRADRQGQAGIHPPPVDMDRAGAAGTAVAALFRARQVKMLAQGVEQGDPRLDRQRMWLSVHLEHDFDHVLRPHRLGLCRARGDRPGPQPARRGGRP